MRDVVIVSAARTAVGAFQGSLSRMPATDLGAQTIVEAMKRAVLCLADSPEYLLVDGINAIPVTIPQRCLKKGDQRSLSISAASIIAKVYRDRIMRSYHERFPVYGFSQNKGYGTAAHLEAIKRYGPTPIHRRTFRGVS